VTSWKTRGKAAPKTPQTRPVAPKPAPAPAPAPKPEPLTLHELLDLRGIARPTKADLLEIAEEFAIDISGASNNSERLAILADHDYPRDAD